MEPGIRRGGRSWSKETGAVDGVATAQMKAEKAHPLQNGGVSSPATVEALSSYAQPLDDAVALGSKE